MHECPGKSSVGTKENGFVCNMLGEPEIYRFPAMHAHGDVGNVRKCRSALFANLKFKSVKQFLDD